MVFKVYIKCLSLFALLFVSNVLAYRINLETSLSAHYTKQWKAIAPANKDSLIPLIFCLKQNNVDVLERIFWEVSDPSHKNYGKHKSIEEINNIIKPNDNSIQIVMNYLRQNGVKKIEHTPSTVSDYIFADMTVEIAEKILQTKFYSYKHDNSKLTLIRSIDGQYSLPSEIAAHVDMVAGVRHFPRVKKSSVSPQLLEKIQQFKGSKQDSWGVGVDPRFLRDLYNVGDAMGTNKNNSQSCVQFLEQYYSSADLDEFFLLFWPESLGQQPTVIGPNNFGAGVEASLDIQYIMSVGSNVPTTFWSNGGREADQEPFLYWLTAVDKTPNPPRLFSVSYGDDEDSLTVEYTTRLNVEFMKQGVRGISVLFASGDSGVGGDGFGCKKFVPDYPASSPYVTAVGGTFSEGVIENGPEVVNSISGGGFSNYFSRPSYQSGAVSAYLTANANRLPTASKWNSTGRAYPDLAAQSAGFYVVVNLFPMPGVAGTSASTPTVSGIMALLNDLRLSKGKSPLGFLNPMLYTIANDHPSVFNKITDGCNPGCGTNGFCADKTGKWSPATGLGTPNYAEFAKYILNY